MSYFTNFVRVPSAGKMGVVLEAITASLAATGRPGFITVPVSAAAPNNPRPGIISTIGGTATLDDIDAIQEALLQNATIMNRLDAIDAMCDRTHWTVSENLSGPLGTPSGYEPKVVGRTFMVAKPGKKQELVDALLGMRDKISSDVKPMLSTPLSGPISAVRITYISTSLQDLEDQRREFHRDRDRNAGLQDLVGQVPIFHLGRVVYRASV
jgi:hypothetical protein